jgi:hypothetical protein
MSPEAMIGMLRENTRKYRYRQLFFEQDSNFPGNESKNWQRGWIASNEKAFTHQGKQLLVSRDNPQIGRKSAATQYSEDI